MQEIDVIRRSRELLLSWAFGNYRLKRVFTDFHPAYSADLTLKPFQRFMIRFNGFVLHPDLVGQLNDGETLIALEAKGSDDWLKGMAQTEFYKTAFHFSFFAIEMRRAQQLVDLCRYKNIGLIGVDTNATMLHVPVIQQPFAEQFNYIRHQLDSVIHVSGAATYQYNIPTHYLVWSIAMDAGQVYTFEALPDLLRNYPIPKGIEYAIAGAKKLGLLRVDDKAIRLSPIGESAKRLLPPDLQTWRQVHLAISDRKSSATLANVEPVSAALLRILLYQDGMVKLLVNALEHFPNFQASFDSLAAECDELDHARAPIFFLKPEAQARLTDAEGRVHWESAEGQDYRSRTFQQYKSILKHAGILDNLPLGGSTSKTYNPQKDIWRLNRAH